MVLVIFLQLERKIMTTEYKELKRTISEAYCLSKNTTEAIDIITEAVAKKFDIPKPKLNILRKGVWANHSDFSGNVYISDVYANSQIIFVRIVNEELVAQIEQDPTKLTVSERNIWSNSWLNRLGELIGAPKLAWPIDTLEESIPQVAHNLDTWEEGDHYVGHWT